MADVRVTGFDHVVLNVPDAVASCEWYRDRLGMETIKLDEFKAGQTLFPSARVNESTIIDFLQQERGTANLDHFCLVIDPVDLDALAASGSFDVVGGPSEVSGAKGMGRSLYVRDLDGNVVELRVY